MIIDHLKEHAYRSRVSEQEKAIKLFHMVFLWNIKYLGRIFEPALIGVWKLLSGKLFSDLIIGGRLFLKGKLPLLPRPIKHRKNLRKLFTLARKNSSAREKEQS